MKRILLVDDEMDLLQVLRTILEDEGYAVTTASSGESALGLLEQARPDAVLMDVMMPYVSGLQILERIRARPEFEHLPVIMMSAVRPRTEVTHPRWDAFLQKPFSLGTVVDTVARVAGPP